MCKKVLGPPKRYSPLHLKFQKRPAPWNYNSSKFISTPSPNFKGGLIPCIIVYLLENQNLNLLFGKITICNFPVSFASS